MIFLFIIKKIKKNKNDSMSSTTLLPPINFKINNESSVQTQLKMKFPLKMVAFLNFIKI